MAFQNQKISDVVKWDTVRETYRIESFGLKLYDVFMNWVGYLRAENITILIPYNFPDFFLNEKFELYVKIQGMNFGPIKVSVI